MNNQPIIKKPIQRVLVKPGFNRGLVKEPIERVIIRPPRK